MLQSTYNDPPSCLRLEKNTGRPQRRQREEQGKMEQVFHESRAIGSGIALTEQQTGHKTKERANKENELLIFLGEDLLKYLSRQEFIEKFAIVNNA